jgi:hypothetical protein
MLEQVRLNYPQTIRFVLSGQSDRESILRTESVRKLHDVDQAMLRSPRSTPPPRRCTMKFQMLEQHGNCFSVFS